MSDTKWSTPGGGGGGARETFVEMSALLTGFAANTIAPPLDPVDLAGTLFETAHQGAGKELDALLAQYTQLSGGTPVKDMSPAQRQRIGNALLGLDGQSQDPRLVATAQSVMRLWYLGSWYPTAGDDSAAAVVSDQAYIRGLAWRAMQSHAMGYSTWTYGYWAQEPPPLSDFTGNPTPQVPVADAGRPTTAAAPRAPSTVGQGKGGQSPASLPPDPVRAAAGTEGGA